MKINPEKSRVEFSACLREEERAAATVLVYSQCIIAFQKWLNERSVTKSTILAYKSYLSGKYAPATVNLHISALNSFFSHSERGELRMKTLKLQKPIFLDRSKELTKLEYFRLVETAEQIGNLRLSLILQTLCSLGLRISELKFITKEAAQEGRAVINLKGKYRIAFLPEKLCLALLEFANSQKIKNGPVFITKNGNPIDRSNVWSDMKKLCQRANVSEEKVFPHNLRHLFARTYYEKEKDIVRLADILGHSSVNTTRIYTMESGETHREQIQNLDLLNC